MFRWFWLIPLLPLAGAVINGLAGKALSRRAVQVIACGAIFGALLLSLVSVWSLSGDLEAIDAVVAKLHSTETMCEVLDDCVQLHGGYGYMWEFPIARAWADNRVSRIAGGSSEIMKEIIGRDLGLDERKRN